MAKKQTSFAEKAEKRGKDNETVYAKYVKSVRSEKTGEWRFNEQMIRMYKGETLDQALKRIDDASNLVDIDLTQFETKSSVENVEDVELDKMEDSTDAEQVVSDSESVQDQDDINTAGSDEETNNGTVKNESDDDEKKDEDVQDEEE